MGSIIVRTIVPIFLLGDFLYGRTCRNIAIAGLLRMVLPPVITLGVTRIRGFPGLQRTTLVLMHSMPTAM